MQIVLNKAATITCSQPDPLFPIECVITYLDMKAHLCNSAGTWTTKQELLSKLSPYSQIRQQFFSEKVSKECRSCE